MTPTKSFKRQTGAALVISLLMLLAMTMMGVTSMRGASTELTMAGNLRESATSFQAAEAGLKTAEGALRDGNDPANVIPENTTDPNYLSSTTWESNNVTTAQLALANVSTSPRYIIKHLGAWDPDRNVSAMDPGFSGYGHVSSARKIDYFRVTARGYGQTGTTFRTLQSFYGR